MSKSNYRLYMEERENAHVVESNNGFATATETGDYFYITDIFIKKECRSIKEASKLADELVVIAKSLNYTKLLGSVDTRANGATISMKVLLGYGMNLHSTKDNIIYFEKSI